MSTKVMKIAEKAYPMFLLRTYLRQWFINHKKDTWFRWINELPDNFKKEIPLVLITDVKNEIIDELGAK